MVIRRNAHRLLRLIDGRIFDPFFTSKAGVGTGLGLAISRRIVEELDGSLVAGRDLHLGGACFTVRLPL